jgi:pantoate kinase
LRGNTEEGERRPEMFGFLKWRTIYRTHDQKEYEKAVKLLEDQGYRVKTYTLDSEVPTGCG